MTTVDDIAEFIAIDLMSRPEIADVRAATGDPAVLEVELTAGGNLFVEVITA